jgi:hypothetical protein
LFFEEHIHCRQNHHAMKNNDPTGELRERITLLTLHCPKELTVDDCPFRMLNELCYGTKKDVLARMDYAALLKLFDYSSTCHCPADPRNGANEFLEIGNEI